ncbi:membrane protein insertion efficiency factor YidD [candidate division KSB1 bacterium]|nr:membrane protein insertion efficiency factor YidD [candidate division KSB1 bacterium]
MNRFFKKSLIFIIVFYKRLLSPLLPNSCRFYPSCSSYAIQAIEKYGALKGLLKSTCRLLRCNPFCKGGYDPV